MKDQMPLKTARSSEPLKTAASPDLQFRNTRFPEPEAPRKLAGGAASPRAGTTGAHGKVTCAPAGAAEINEVRRT